MAGLTLAAVGVLIHLVGGRVVRTVLPPVVSGAVVMLIGFNLARRRRRVLAAGSGGALTVMILTIVAAVAFCQLVRDGLDLLDGAEHLDAHPAADHVRAALVVGRP